MPILRDNLGLGKLPHEGLRENLPSQQGSTFGSGLVGNFQTLQTMQKLAHLRSRDPLVRELAERIVLYAGVGSMDYINEAKAIGEYVKTHMRYLRDSTDSERVMDPLTMIERMERGVLQGDCDDKSLLIATLLLSIGHHPYFRVVRYTDTDGPYEHVYVVEYETNYRTPRSRVVLDAILERYPIGAEMSHARGEEVLV